MINKLILSYIVACSFGGVISYLVVPAGVNSAIYDFLLVFVVVFLGPLSTFLFSTLVPTTLLIPLCIVGAIGLFLTVKAYKSQKLISLYIGNGLWALSGAIITTLGFIGGCC